MKRILVTGATGFIGLEISRQLAARGLRPRLMVRRPLRGMMLKNLDVDLVQADLRSPRSLIRAVEGVDTIFHLGARAALESYSRLYPSIVGGSRSLMRVAVACGVRQVVYGGSLMVYADTPAGIDRNTVPRPISGYGRAKLEAERQMQALAAAGGSRHTCPRAEHDTALPVHPRRHTGGSGRRHFVLLAAVQSRPGVTEKLQIALVPQLSDFDAQCDTLFAGHTRIGILVRQIVLDRFVAFAQGDHGGLFFVIVVHIDIDAAFADIRVDRFDFFAQ
jgi:NAD(P)-dependent dehydrogenase (short-subunit alcohol dehydrogenase family)